MKFIFTLLLIVGSSIFAMADTESGLYQIDINFIYPSNPMYASAPKSSNSRHCARQGDVQGSVFKLMSEQPGCKLLEQKMNNNKASWKISCAKGISTGEGNIEFQKNSFSGENTSRVKMPGMQDMVIKTMYKGKKIGECK